VRTSILISTVVALCGFVLSAQARQKPETPTQAARLQRTEAEARESAERHRKSGGNSES
jgi:hypothetical protein